MREIKKIFKSVVEWRILATVLLFFGVLIIILPRETEATLSCSLASSCTAPDVALLNMASTTNSHVSIGTSTDYNTNIMCCKNVAGLSSACSGTGVSRAIVNLSSTTNAHIESSSLANYPVQACLHVATGGYVSSTVQLTDCSGYDVTIGSMTSTTNSHMGAAADYTYKICASAAAPPQSLSFSIDYNSITFGNLSPLVRRYAQPSTYGDGSNSETSATNLDVSTNAQYGYVITVIGDTLKSGTTTIPAMTGPTPNYGTPGTNEFGINLTAPGLTTPYNYNQGYIYTADATTTMEIGRMTTGDGINTTIYIRYMANISPSLKPGAYSTVLTYIATAEY